MGNRPTTIRKPRTGGVIHALRGSVHGAHRDSQVEDLRLARDLNRVVLREDFIGGADIKAVTDTATSAVTRQGFRVFGQGIAETDSGLAEVSGDLGQDLITTNEAEHTAAVGTPVFLQPDTHGPFRLSAIFKAPNIADFALFAGFCGTAADAIDPRVTGSGTTITLVDDDLAGAYVDSGLTDDDGWFAPHNKSNAAASIATTATGVDLGKALVAATLTVVTVEVDEDGNMVVTVSDANGTATTSIDGALDADEEVAAVIYAESQTTATKQIQLIAYELDYYVEN